MTGSNVRGCGTNYSTAISKVRQLLLRVAVQGKSLNVLVLIILTLNLSLNLARDMTLKGDRGGFFLLPDHWFVFLLVLSARSHFTT